MKEINLLDCTIRDGGYYNNWKFNVRDVKNYLNQIYETKTKVIEIGFNFFDTKNKDYGEFAKCEVDVLKKLPRSSKVKLAIMINANELINTKFDEKALKKNFSPKLSYVSIIRIATHYKDIFKITKYSKVLKKLGFKIYLNLMQINTVSSKKLADLLKKINKTDCYEVFYFADSFGNLTPNKVKNICSIIKKNWDKSIGFHSHDNCGLALRNVLSATKHGVSWIDSTIQGMGRGAGNVKTEDILKKFSKKNNDFKKIQSTSIFFLKLKKKYNWGSSPYYKFAAQHNIHPTYVQELKKDNRYSHKELIDIISQISKFNARSYDPNLLSKIYTNKKDYIGKWNAKNWIGNRKLLILGQGPSIKKKKKIERLIQFINKNNPVVLSININNFLPKKYINYYAMFNDKRILVDSYNYKTLNKPLIVPNNILKKVGQKTKIKKTLDYGAIIKNRTFSVKKQFCILPNNQSFGYALALAAIGGADKIFVIGFDGFSKGHYYNYEMETVLKMFKEKFKGISISSLSETVYSIKKTNIL